MGLGFLDGLLLDLFSLGGSLFDLFEQLLVLGLLDGLHLGTTLTSFVELLSYLFGDLDDILDLLRSVGLSLLNLGHHLVDLLGLDFLEFGLSLLDSLDSLIGK